MLIKEVVKINSLQNVKTRGHTLIMFRSLKDEVIFHYYCVPLEEDVIIDPERGECVFDLKGSMAVVDPADMYSLF